MWRERRWRDLLTLIDWLPRASAYMEAMSEDDELARQILDQKDDGKKRAPRGPRISEWSTEVEKMTDIVDRLGELMQATVAANGGKPPKIKPQPRPRTAIDRMRDKRRMEHHRKVVSRVLIQQPDGTTKRISLGPPPGGKPVVKAQGKTVLQPGEDPFRLKAPRRRGAPPPTGPITGEPR